MDIIEFSRSAVACKLRNEEIPFAISHETKYNGRIKNAYFDGGKNIPVSLRQHRLYIARQKGVYK